MKTSRVIGLLWLFFNLNLLAQVREAWVARYNYGEDIAKAIAVDSSGNVYVTGYSTGNGTGFDYATVKYDTNGNQLWAARYNGPGNYDDWGLAIAIDGAGNAYVTGGSMGVGSNSDYTTIKYDAEGNMMWLARYNGPGNGVDVALAICLDADGNVYVTGGSTGIGTMQYATIKYDADGNQMWVARYNGPESGDNWAKALAVDADGNIYVTGYSKGVYDGFDYATIKYDPDGNPVWTSRYNGSGNGDDRANALALDAKGNVYVTGGSAGIGTDSDYTTIKYDTEGSPVWIARYNGPGNGVDRATAIAIDAEDNVYVTGYSVGTGTSFDYATIRYDTEGNQVWVARYNGPGNMDDYAIAIALDSEGNPYVTGGSRTLTANYHYATIGYNSAGNQVWIAWYIGPGNSYDYPSALTVDADDNLYVTGQSIGLRTGLDYATIKYAQK